MNYYRPTIDRERLRALFVAGYSVPQLAEALECQKPAIRRNLDLLGLLRMKKRGPNRFTRPRAVIAEIVPVETRQAPTFVDRDPCTYCGVRSDVGCKHNRSIAA